MQMPGHSSLVPAPHSASVSVDRFSRAVTFQDSHTGHVKFGIAGLWPVLCSGAGSVGARPMHLACQNA